MQTHSKDLCTSLTTDRSPCDARRIGWSRFCWHHQPWPEVGIATVIALIVVVNGTWFVALRGAQWTRELAARLSEGARIETSHADPGFELPGLRAGERILIGNVSYADAPRQLELGDSHYELDRSAEGGFSLSGEIRDAGGRNVVARIEKSRLFVAPGYAYDINADASAIEVVDPTMRPVLQFTRDAGGLVGWMGTYQRSGEVLLCRDTCATLPEKDALPILAGQRRIFQYPGYLHPGARER
jgi:hypothetical protein